MNSFAFGVLLALITMGETPHEHTFVSFNRTNMAIVLFRVYAVLTIAINCLES